MDRTTLILRPTATILDNMMSVAAARHWAAPEAEFRAMVWLSLLGLRRLHGSLAAARGAAAVRRAVAVPVCHRPTA
jgi:hypothetical protein